MAAKPKCFIHSKEGAEKVAEILLDVGSVKLRPKTPFTFASGLKSPIYTDCRLLISFPKQRNEVIALFEEIVIKKIGKDNVDVIAGTASAGIPHAAFLAQRLGKPMIYVRKEAKDHGTSKLIEGELLKDQRVLLVEDLITTGGSSLAAAEAINKAGGKVNWCLAIFTYGFGNVFDAFAKKDIQLHVLSDIISLKEVAFNSEIISYEEKILIEKWLSENKVEK
jgi:orotate phosphoribosyltransferase